MPGLDTNTVLTIFRADTSQAEAAVKRLRGTERERAKGVLDDLNRENAELKSSVATWGKVGLAIGAVAAAYKILQATGRDYLEDLRLESAAAGINIDRLRESVQGLAETDQLLAFAGRTQNAIWKLNQREMELVLQGANALRIQMGAELKPTIDALTESIVKGSSRGLKEFGIEAKDKTQLLAAMERAVGSLGGKTSLAGDDFERAGVQWADAVDDLRGALGSLAVQLAPVVSLMANFTSELATAIKETVEFDRELKRGLDDFLVWMDTALGFDTQRVRRAEAAGRADWKSAERERKRALGLAVIEPGAQAPVTTEPLIGPPTPQTSPWALSVEERLKILRGGTVDPWRQAGPAALPEGFERKAGERNQDFEARMREAGELERAYMAVAKWREEAEAAEVEAGFEAREEALKAFEAKGQEGVDWFDRQRKEADELDKRFAGVADRSREVHAALQQSMELASSSQRNILETLFGTPAQIDLMTASLKQAGAAFNIVFQAGGAAMDAWITGQKSLGAAFKEAIAEGLRGLAVQATVEALKHTAFGVGDLAFFNYAGAAQHFTAAGLFGGVAVAAGVGAKLLGAGAPSVPSGAGTGSSAGSALGARPRSTPNEPQQRQTTILLGRDLLALTDLEQRQLVYQAIQQGNVMDVSTSTIQRG